MAENLVPPTDEFIESIAKMYGMTYTKGKKGEDRFYSDDGAPIYPLNDGAVGDVKVITLKAGSGLVDRYGRSSGRYLSPEGTPIEQRSLSKDAKKQTYHVYKVIRDIENVEEGLIAPWFNDPGGGIQYRLPKTIDELSGYLKEVDK